MKRYQEPLVVALLLVYPLAKFLRTGHRQLPPSVLEKAILGVASPFERGLDASIDFVAGGIRSYIALRGVRQDNERLRQENSELKLQQKTFQEVLLENHRLRLLLDYAEHSAQKEILAKVIGVNPVSHALSVRINRGLDDGLSVSMPVLTAEGLVGQVERLVPAWADVRLLTDRNSRVAVLTQRGRVRGTAAGVGNNKTLVLQNVQKVEDVVVGDVIVTSGTDNIFPKGLVVGKITRVEKPPNGMFLDATIEPSVSFSHLEEVLVLPVLSGGSLGEETP